MWWKAFEKNGLHGASSAGRHVAQNVAASPSRRDRAYDNFRDVIITFNEYWAGISGLLELVSLVFL